MTLSLNVILQEAPLIIKLLRTKTMMTVLKMSLPVVTTTLLVLFYPVGGFVQPAAFLRQTTHTTALNGGYGIATNYTWTEEPFEMEITVSVPPDTRAKDVVFKATPTSIDLRLQGQEEPLLDGTRKMRGRISLDGTYWVISDSETDTEDRQVTVTIEKNTPTRKDDFEVVDYDWRGVYPDDDEEVSERKYEEPEELDVREYAASLGVDIDNINMSMVDKTMFSSGLNVTRSTMDELSKSGYVQEVTQQSDGTEYITNEDGEVVPFSRLGDTVEDEEVREATSAAGQPPKIPFLDTNSPWHSAVPVDDINEDIVDNTEDGPEQTSIAAKEEEEDNDSLPDRKQASDPIDLLTVNRLKDILRAQGLKVSGSKQELKDRLRGHVASMMTIEDDKAGENISNS